MDPINADGTALLLLLALALMLVGIWLARPRAEARLSRTRLFDAGVLIAVATLAYNAVAGAW